MSAVETFTGDGWQFNGASVTAKGGGTRPDVQAPRRSAACPAPGTAASPDEIVPVGYGTAPEYKGVDVEGKIAFAWWDYDKLGIWPNYIAYEAKAHGAEAVMIASAPGHPGIRPATDALSAATTASAHHAACAPMVVISKRSAASVAGAIDDGTVEGTVTLDAEN